MQYRLVYSLACAEDDTEQQRAEQQAQIDAYFDAYAPAQQRLSKAFRAKFEDGVFNGFVLRGVALLPKAGNAARRVVLTVEEWEPHVGARIYQITYRGVTSFCADFSSVEGLCVFQSEVLPCGDGVSHEFLFETQSGQTATLRVECARIGLNIENGAAERGEHSACAHNPA